MSYRIYASIGSREIQLFGNNEYPKHFLEELKNQGCKIDEEYCFNKFKIKSLPPIIKAIEKDIIDIVNSRNERYKKVLDRYHEIGKEITDEDLDDEYSLVKTVTVDCYPTCNFTNSYKDGIKDNNLTTRMLESFDCGYIFISARLLNFIGSKKYEWGYNLEHKCIEYKLREGVNLYFEAY